LTVEKFVDLMTVNFNQWWGYNLKVMQFLRR